MLLFLVYRSGAIDQFYLVLGFVAVIGLLTASIINVSAFGLRSIVHLFGIITLFSLYFVRHTLDKYLSYSIIRWSLFLYVFISVLQIFDPTFGSIFVSRDAAQTLEYAVGGRGSRSLTGEPSQFGEIITILYILLLHSLQKNRQNGEINKSILSKKYTLYSILLLLTLTILCRSATALFYFIIIAFVLGVYLRLWPQLIKFIIGGGIVVGLGILFLAESRLTMVLINLASDPDFILKQGAFARIYNLPITIAAAFENFPFGTGVESRLGHFVTVWTPLGDYTIYVKSRTLGGIMELLLNYGLLSIFAFVVVFWLFVSSEYKVFSACLFFLILQSGAPFMPTVLLGIVVLTVPSNPDNLWKERRGSA